MANRIFFLTYENRSHCNSSKEHSVVGYDCKSSQAQKMRHLRPGDIVVLRTMEEKSAIGLYGAFEVTGRPMEVNQNAPLVWQQERDAGQVLYELRVPAVYNEEISKRMPRVLQYSDILKLGLKNTLGKPYSSTSLGVLFRANMVSPQNDAAFRKLLRIDE